METGCFSLWLLDTFMQSDAPSHLLAQLLLLLVLPLALLQAAPSAISHTVLTTWGVVCIVIMNGRPQTV